MKRTRKKKFFVSKSEYPVQNNFKIQIDKSSIFYALFIWQTYVYFCGFIVLYNIFGEAATPMLFFKIEEDLWSVMKTFIIFLNRFPSYPKCSLHDVAVDIDCLKQLQQVCKKDETRVNTIIKASNTNPFWALDLSLWVHLWYVILILHIHN